MTAHAPQGDRNAPVPDASALPPMRRVKPPLWKRMALSLLPRKTVTIAPEPDQRCTCRSDWTSYKRCPVHVWNSAKSLPVVVHICPHCKQLFDSPSVCFSGQPTIPLAQVPAVVEVLRDQRGPGIEFAMRIERQFGRQNGHTDISWAQLQEDDAA